MRPRAQLYPLFEPWDYSLGFQLRMQLTQHYLIQLRSNRVDLDLADDFLGKTVSQQTAAQFGIDSARLQVEQLFLVDLSDRRAVRALHIVGVNLQLRLRVDARLLRQQQVLVRLHRIGLLCALTHEDLAVKNS